MSRKELELIDLGELSVPIIHYLSTISVILQHYVISWIAFVLDKYNIQRMIFMVFIGK